MFYTHAPNSAQAYIGKIANSLSKVVDPFKRQSLLAELTRDINLRHLCPCNMAKVKTYSKNLSKKIQQEAQFFTMQQVGNPFSKILGDLTPS